MAVNTINYRIKDSEADSKLSSFPLYVPTGLTLAQYNSFGVTAAELIDAVTGGVIVSADMKVDLNLSTATLKSTPDAGHLNERGGIIGMDTAGQFDDSVRIPAILTSIMAGDTFLLTQTDVAALILMLTAGDGVVFPRNRDGFIWQGTGLYGHKSFRRK